MGKLSANRSIDMRGKSITPFIIYYAVKNLKDMQNGEILEVQTDNFESIGNDMNAWSRMSGYPITDMEMADTYQRYYIQKVAPPRRNQKLAMIISDASLEGLLSPLGMALSAALAGSEVHLFFQGPAVRVLKKGYQASLNGIQKPFSSFARKAMAKAGHLPPSEKLAQMKELGAHFYICGGSMDHFGVAEDQLIFDGVTIAQYPTFLEVMESADLQFFLQ
jgi:predicted peroxiredoxin/TusA-related sulfurtransferase